MKHKSQSISPVRFHKLKSLPKSQPKPKRIYKANYKKQNNSKKKLPPLLQNQLDLLYNQMISSSTNPLNLKWINNFKNLIKTNQCFNLNVITSENIIPKSKNNFGSLLLKKNKFWLLYIEYFHSLLNLNNLVSIMKTAVKYMCTKEQILTLQKAFSCKIKQLKISMNEINNYCTKNNITINENDLNYEYLLASQMKGQIHEVIHPGNMHKQMDYEDKNEPKIKLESKSREQTDISMTGISQESSFQMNKSDILMDKVNYSQISNSGKEKYKQLFSQQTGIDNTKILGELQQLQNIIEDIPTKHKNKNDIDFIFEASEAQSINPLLQLLGNDSKTKSFSISNEGDNVFVTEPLSFNLSNAENNFLQEEDSYVCYLQQKAQEKGEELSNFWKSNFNINTIDEKVLSLTTPMHKKRNVNIKYNDEENIFNLDYDL